MPPKRKGRERVQCMTCQAVINGDEQNSHKRRIHQNAAHQLDLWRKKFVLTSEHQNICWIVMGDSPETKILPPS